MKISMRTERPRLLVHLGVVSVSQQDPRTGRAASSPLPYLGTPLGEGEGKALMWTRTSLPSGSATTMR